MTIVPSPSAVAPVADRSVGQIEAETPPEAATADSPRRGRPRDARADSAILTATTQVLAEDGWAGLTIEQVAARAGVARTTVYRRYATREELAVAAVATLFPHQVTGLPPTATKDVPLDRTRTYAAIRQFANALQQPLASAAYPSVIAAAHSNPRLRAAVDEQILAPMQAMIRGLLQDSVVAGVAPAAAASDEQTALIFDLVAGAMVHRFLIRQEPLTEDFQSQLAAIVRALASGAFLPS